MQLKKALNIFLADYKESTARAYAGCLHPLLEVLGPAREADRVRPIELTEYIHDLMSDERGLSEATQQKHIKTIKTFFRWLHRMEISDSDKSKNLRQKRISRQIDRNKAMKDDELEAILTYAQYFPRNYAIILFLADTGCRAGGVATLRIGRSIDPDQTPTAPGLYLDRYMAIVTEKGDKMRPVAFGKKTAGALAEWLLQRPQADHDFVFTWGKNRLTPEAVSQIVRRACKRVGIRSLGAHSLRHRKGHQLADSGQPITVAATVLGHSDPMITAMFYYPNDWGRALDAMSQLFVEDTDETLNFNTDKIRKIK